MDVSWDKMEEKIADYHAFGVDLGWVLDPQTRALRAYPRRAAPVLLHDHHTATADPSLPGFAVRVRQFFED